MPSRCLISFSALADLASEKPVGFSKFSGPFLDPGLKFRMRSRELFLRTLAFSDIAHESIEAVRVPVLSSANRKLDRQFVAVSMHGGDLNAFVH